MQLRDRDDAIVKDWEKGIDASAIAQKYGVSERTIYRIKLKHERRDLDF